MAHPLFALLRALDQQRLWTMIDNASPDVVTLTVMIADGRVEIDVFENGQIEYAAIGEGGGEGAQQATEAVRRTLGLFGAVPRRIPSLEQ